ncbi:hypothetical protein LIER_24609 [Lithospermum erythrorhizon]|uniref:Uncharacterized protein n=1 Tax=Lithospermum erythrorhizon TaxID=34254 RepID=A0AAV3R1N0_LITER
MNDQGLKSFVDETPRTINFIRQVNGGPAAAMERDEVVVRRIAPPAKEDKENMNIGHSIVLSAALHGSLVLAGFVCGAHVLGGYISGSITGAADNFGERFQEVVENYGERFQEVVENYGERFQVGEKLVKGFQQISVLEFCWPSWFIGSCWLCLRCSCPEGYISGSITGAADKHGEKLVKGCQ